jgi:hypothetical protein
MFRRRVSTIDLVLIDQQTVEKRSLSGEKSSDGHCQCEKEMDDHLLARQ